MKLSYCLAVLWTAIGLGNSMQARAQDQDSRTILFARLQSQYFHLFLLNPNGTEVAQLTSGKGHSFPAWSPDGKRIAFASSRSGIAEIYTRDADGGNAVKLTETHSSRAPAWSPDGKRIAFTRSLPLDGQVTNPELFVMDADGSNLVNLSNNPAFDSDAAWSPDGKNIAFTSNRDGKFALYVMDAEGGKVRRLSPPHCRGWVYPAWSPDGRHIAHTDLDAQGRHVLTIRDADGSNPRHLTKQGFDTHSAWSPDGRQIAFLRWSGKLGELGDLCLIDADGNNLKFIARGKGDSEISRPAWKPVIR